MLHVFYCSIDKNTNSNFVEFCVCVLYPDFGKATRFRGIVSFSVAFWVKLHHPFLSVMQSGNLLPPLSSSWQSQDRPTGAGKVPVWLHLLFAAWVVCPQQEFDVGHCLGHSLGALLGFSSQAAPAGFVHCCLIFTDITT